jgi:hypothetical protein
MTPAPPSGGAPAITSATSAAPATTGHGARAGMLASFAAVMAQAAAAGDLDAVHVAHDAITRLLAAPGVATANGAG